MRRRVRPGGALTALGVLVSVAVLAVLAFWAVRQDPPALPTSAPALVALVAAVGVYLVGCAARAERWLVLLEHNGAAPRRVDAYGLTAVGNLGNNLLPARAGDALRVVLLSPRAGTDRRTVIGTLLAERVLDVAVLGLLFVVLAPTVMGGLALLTGPVATAALVLAALVAVLVVLAPVLRRSSRVRRLGGFLAPIVAATRGIRGRHGALVVTWSVAVWSIELLAWWLTSLAAGLDLGLLAVGYLLGLAAIFVLVPSGPGNAGTFDAALIFGMLGLGQGGSATLSYLLLLRFVTVVPITVAGLVALVTRYGGLGAVRSAERA